MTLLDRIERIQKLWAVMLPHIAAPEPVWIGRWCVQTDKVIEHAIIRTSKKFSTAIHSGEIPPETVWRYTSGVVANEGEGKGDRSMKRHRVVPTNRKKMNSETFVRELDDIAAKITSHPSSELGDLGEKYLDTLERFLQFDPAGFFDWLNELLGHNDPTRNQAADLLKTGAVDSTTTFGDLREIIKQGGNER